MLPYIIDLGSLESLLALAFFDLASDLVEVLKIFGTLLNSLQQSFPVNQVTNGVIASYSS